MTDDPCDECGDPVTDALSRTVQLAVDRTQIDAHRLCPDCFATWIDRYQREMQTGSTTVNVGDDDIIVD
ncbi:DUF7569 family protein [Haloarchaeobius sp. HRN-SO-5]|uniref:DUF7569 family protein n=1 Tax=Haloarchaeobius sp. HRN-SO-5 TaxID=3446118 RepID=UPI003EB955FD